MPEGEVGTTEGECSTWGGWLLLAEIEDCLAELVHGDFV